MLSRSSSFTLSYTESLNENSKSTANFRHQELLQNLQQTQRQIRPTLSRPLNIENNNQLHFLNSLNNEKKSEEQIHTIKRTTVQDDIENIQEHLDAMLIAATTANDNETLLLPIEQTLTTQYFTPKISIDENGKKKIDEHDSHLINDENQTDDDRYPATNRTESSTHPFFDVLSTTSYEKEVMKYLLNLEARFMNENEKLRSEKRFRESTNCLKPAQGVPISGSNLTVLITSKVRCKLLDWIISVHDYHRLNAAILCGTINMIDRILLLNDQMTKLDLQLRPINYFTIVCKLESRRIPDTNSLFSLFNARHHVTSIILNHNAKQLLTQLDFELA